MNTNTFLVGAHPTSPPENTFVVSYKSYDIFCPVILNVGVEEDKDILCFVHNVSPVKQGQKTTYFPAKLQTLNDVVCAVSFSPKRRSELCRYENAKSPVKVLKFKMSARKGYDNDVIINNYMSLAPTSSERTSSESQLHLSINQWQLLLLQQCHSCKIFHWSNLSVYMPKVWSCLQ